METIFNYNPTDDELDEMLPRDDGRTEAEYLAVLLERTLACDSSIFYECTVDLQQLFYLRGELSQLKKYTRILHEDLAEIRRKIFNK